MKEVFPNKKLEKLSRKTKIFQGFIDLKRSQGMEKATDILFQGANIEVQYLQKEKNGENFNKMRDKLANESGVVIANHPDITDTLYILKAIGDRKDIMLFTTPAMTNLYAGINDEYQTATKEDENYQEKLINHINNGGIVIFFPTAGDERASRKLTFRKGFGKIFVDNLDPDCMVYNLYINIQDIENVAGITTWQDFTAPNPKRDKMLSGMVETVEKPEMSQESPEDKSIVRVDERYTQIKEWKELGSIEPNILAQHYLNIFNLNKNVDKN